MSKINIVSVEIIEHRDTGLLVGMSEDMKGLYVHGRSLDEMERRIPLAIREILEAEGRKNVVVRPVDDARDLPPVFSSHSVRKFELAA